ncbi:DinB family protein [Mucilaginibacter auburnensis]|uniref:DinB family protein n=1 Tax=Mucilaginibacter auburnensis TaxID=1457233 RepID=A0A2H9VVQ3_9SPHI|nr:DinB family protein [Mucilaginibacter auburnensis]PJJ84869.1 DinB family protein [Mucilaginibacter auburnensis]
MIDIANRLCEAVEEFIKLHSKEVNWKHRSAPGKWSAIEIIGHLTDSAVVNLHRFVRCNYDDDFTLNYLQNDWVKAQHYHEADIDELLSLWQLLNHRIIIVWRKFPVERLQAKCNGQTVENLGKDYLAHLRHHLNQIVHLKAGN